MDLTGWQLASLVGVVLPLVVGVVTKINAPAGVKALLLLTLTVVSTPLQLLASDNASMGGVHLGEEFWRQLVLTWLVAVGTYYGVYKPTDVASKLLPQVGVGPEANYGEVGE